MKKLAIAAETVEFITKTTLPMEDIIDLLSSCLNTTYFVFDVI
jgi:hypothetical protein